MADSLTTNPLVIDIAASVTNRTVDTRRLHVKRILLDGIKPASTTNLMLRANSVAGAIVWKHQGDAVAAPVHAQDDVEIFVEGLFFDGGGGALWSAGATLLVYLA